MLKKRLRYSFISVLLILIGCAPRVAPPPPYQGMDLTLEEVLSRASGDIRMLRAVVDVQVERDGRYHSSVSASLLVKSPGLVHMRVYRFGILLDEILVRGDAERRLSGKGGGWLEDVGPEFYHAVFWWDGMRDAYMVRHGPEYVIQKKDKEMRIDRETLFPLRQSIRRDGRLARIHYRKPQKWGDYWFPSEIRIHLDRYTFLVKVAKLFINPEPGEMDFRLPGEGDRLIQPFIRGQVRG